MTRIVMTLVVLFAGAVAMAAETPKKAPGPKAKAKAAKVKPADEWIDLFDGQTLKGWIIIGGFAKYYVDDGAIVGVAQEFSPNTFLCTAKSYGDFILEFESKNDPALNSGVQIRSKVYPEETVLMMERDGKQIRRVFPAGRVYGYQVEISNEETGTSGGIYDEARRGVWLYDASQNPPERKTFKDNQWNHFRVECRGNTIKTFVNGALAAELTDDTDARGLIGLQVHSIKGNEPLEVRWRNIRIKELGEPAP